MSKRPTLSIARTSRKPSRPTFSEVKKAIRLFRGRGVSKAVYRRNALAWLKANAALGERHLLKGGNASWGRPGEPRIEQVFAPRRFSGAR